MDPPIDSGSGQYALLDQLAEEFADRYRRGERPSLAEYIDRYPGLAEEIRALFPALVEVEQVKEDWRVEPTGTATAPPLQVGDYRIVREVGRGGMGVVYEAEQVSLGRRVALKVLPRSTIRDDSTVERFRREARSAARLHHTNIVPVFEVGQDGDSVYYAMQFIQGQGLDLVIDELRRLRGSGAQEPGRGARSPGDRKAPSDPAAAGPPRAGAAGPRPESGEPRPDPRVPGLESQARRLGRTAQSLLTGRFAPPDPGDSSELAATEVITDRVDPDETVTGGPPSTVAPGPSASAALPGVKALSTIELVGRLPFYRSVARIGQQAAQGLAYAHARGVVHRDIKPSNLLLDAAGVVWITDFGLAKVEDDGLTRTGDILGTLRYMAPERFRGEGDARADVYALGLTLYELLTMRPAFDSPDRLRLIEQIKAEEPRHPRAIDPRIPRDLETVVLKAIGKDPRRRYATAEALAQDLQRFLEDRPVQARRSSLAERAWRTCKRNPLASTLAAGLLLALAVGLGGVTTQWLRAEANAERARVQGAAAVRARNDALLQRDEARQANRQLRAALAKIRGDAYVLDIREARRALDERNPARVRELLDRQRPGPSEADLRGFEWYYLQRRAATFDDRRTLRGHRGGVQAVAFHPDGHLVATGGLDGTVRLWEVADGRELRTLAAESGPISSVAFRPDGAMLAAGSWNGLVALWDIPAGEPIRTFTAHDSSVYDLAFSPDGRRLATAGRTVKLWDVETRGTGHEPRELQGGTGLVRAVAFSPDGRLLASARGGGAVANANAAIDLWETDTGRRLRTIPSPGGVWIYDLAFHPDGRRLTAAHSYEGVVTWDVETGREAGRLAGHAGQVHRIAYSADGRILASAGDGDQIWIWDAATNQRLRVLEGRVDHYGGLALGPAGTSLAAAGGTPTAFLWDLEARATDATLEGHEGDVIFAAYSPDGRTLASCGKDNCVRLWDVAGRAVRHTLRGHRERVFAVAFSPDGGRLASASFDGTVVLWDTADGRALRTFTGHAGPVLGVAFHPDGRRVASAGGTNLGAAAGGDRSIRIWDAGTGRELLRLDGHESQVRWVTFSPDGRHLASSGHYDGTVRLWDVEKGRLVRTFHTGSVGAGVSAFRRDGRALAATTQNGGTVKVWDVGDGSERLTLRGHSGAVWGVAFSPDGRRLASAGTDRSVRVWDAASGEELLRLDGHNGFTTSVAFRPDGRQLASAGHDRTVRLWDADGSRYWDEQAAALATDLDRAPARADLAYAEVGESIPEVFARIAALRPHDARLRVERARALTLQGRSEQAEAAFAAAAAVAGGDLQVFLDSGWWVIGPYPGNLGATCPPESVPDPSQPVNGVPLTPREGQAVLHWRDMRPGFNDIEDVLTPRSDGADISAYALAHVYTPRERRATLAIGGVNPMRAWLNERPIYQYDPARPSSQARDLVAVTLRAGRNTLLLKVATGDGPMKAYVSFVQDPVDPGPRRLPGDRWAPLLADLEAAAAAAPESPGYRFGIAGVRLISGDRAASSDALRELIDRYGDNSDYLLIYTSWLCGMSPDADIDRERLVRALRRARESNPSWPSMTARVQLADPLGVALLRAGRFAEAIERLEAFDAARGRGTNAASQLYRALAYHHLGRLEDARRELDGARAWLAAFRQDPLHPSWPLARRPSSGDRLEWRLLLREAEGLIGRAPPAGSSPRRP